MKKIILTIVMILAITSNVMADKATSYINIRDIEIKMVFSKPVSVVIDEGLETENYETKYQKVRVLYSCKAITSDGGIRKISNSIYLGQVQDAPLTPKEIYNALPASLQPGFKDMIIEAINSNVTE